MVLFLMSSQLFELLIFAGVAFLIINKLVSTLGVTDEDDPARKSFFGEKTKRGIKDVTNSAPGYSSKNYQITDHNGQDQSQESIDVPLEIIVQENFEPIKEASLLIKKQVNNFDLTKFIRNASKAFAIIIDAGIESDDEICSALIDKSYLQSFKDRVQDYGKIADKDSLEAKISYVSVLGNNAFVKVLFTGKNVVSKQEILNEEWVFVKNLSKNSPDWYLIKIEDS